MRVTISRGHRIIRRLGLSVFIFLMLWGGIEYWAHRQLLKSDGLPGRYFFVGLNGLTAPADPANQPIAVRLDPWVLYRPVASQRLGYCTINAAGFRGPEIQPTAGGTVAITGGSAAFGHGAASDSETFASLLAARLAPRRLQVINTAFTGYLSGEELSMSAHYLAEYKPQLVIAFTGWNDVYGRIVADWDIPCHAGYQAIRQRHAAYLAITERTAAPWQRYWSGWRAASPLCEYIVLQRNEGKPVFTTTTTVSEKTARLPAIINDFCSNMLAMQALTTGRGGRLLVVLQPEAMLRRTPAEAEKNISAPPEYPAYREEFPQLYAIFRREAGRRLRAAGVHCLDAESAIADAGDQMFLDMVHLSPPGHARIAHWLALHAGL